MTDVINEFKKTRIIPVIKIEESQETYSIIGAIRAGGIMNAEITLRTPAAVEAIRIAARNFSDMAIGAGTVLNLQQAKDAIEAGADFIVMPGYNEEIVDYCQRKKITVIPGVATPTEIMTAYNKGCKILKLFPASNLGGAAYLDAMKGPFSDVQFIPTGGISFGNAREYLSKENVLAVGASCIVTGKDISQKNWPAITENCRQAVSLFSAVIN
ncbi:MAG: bifunctional 4-hydroxy-2-oxoglutarate aldolase/2-dehydro-3-deoxy-phosphogluconate aldolase [Treponema sp.]|nr:bifunctional 4-hydroxy-2-oxoglutarate aldolase/2-dehydro-3-deoxy-phosphogluconate aldolase [Treponema sp.]